MAGISEQCWIWPFAASKAGYGQKRIGGKATYTHRVAYETLVGPIPDGLVIDHLCRVTRCYNPSHLQPVTRQENARRGKWGALTTHCPQGHPYDEENTYVDPDGARRCRTCHRAEARRR